MQWGARSVAPQTWCWRRMQSGVARIFFFSDIVPSASLSSPSADRASPPTATERPERDSASKSSTIRASHSTSMNPTITNGGYKKAHAPRARSVQVRSPAIRRHRERSEAIQKQQRARNTGLLRRCAPRNDGLSLSDSIYSNPALAEPLTQAGQDFFGVGSEKAFLIEARGMEDKVAEAKLNIGRDLFDMLLGIGRNNPPARDTLERQHRSKALKLERVGDAGLLLR